MGLNIERSQALTVALGSLAGTGGLFTFQIIMARSLSSSDFGLFYGALAQVNLLITVAAFGFTGFWQKEFGEQGVIRKDILDTSIFYLIFTTVLAVILIASVAGSLAPNALGERLTRILALLAIGYTAVEFGSVFSQILRRHGRLACWLSVTGVSRALIVALVVLLGNELLDPISLSVLLAASSFFLIIPAGALLRRVRTDALDTASTSVTTSGSIWSGWIGRLYSFFLACFPFGIGNVLYLAYSQFPVIYLGRILGVEAVANYGLAAIVMGIVYHVPSLLMQRIFAIDIHAAVTRSARDASRIFSNLALKFCLLGTIVAIVGIAATDHLISIAFGGKYVDASRMAQIMLVATPFRFLETVVGLFLMTRGLMKYKSASVALVSVLQIPLLATFVKIGGSTGAAFSFVVCEILLVGLFYYALKKNLFNGKNEVRL